jgi:hypothetical protein
MGVNCKRIIIMPQPTVLAYAEHMIKYMKAKILLRTCKTRETKAKIVLLCTKNNYFLLVSLQKEIAKSENLKKN